MNPRWFGCSWLINDFREGSTEARRRSDVERDRRNRDTTEGREGQRLQILIAIRFIFQLHQQRIRLAKRILGGNGQRSWSVLLATLISPLVYPFQNIRSMYIHLAKHKDDDIVLKELILCHTHAKPPILKQVTVSRLQYFQVLGELQ
ncbi:hypothetical protein LXL04_002042 [Taraxacum kok-saghyz]